MNLHCIVVPGQYAFERGVNLVQPVALEFPDVIDVENVAVRFSVKVIIAIFKLIIERWQRLRLRGNFFCLHSGG